MATEPFDAVLLLSHLWVQNANTVSSPLTWGFPAPSAFTGFAHALQRRLNAAGHSLRLGGVGIVCHDFEPQTFRPPGRYNKVFRLTRNPVGQDGDPVAIVEDGRAHFEASLVIPISGDRLPLIPAECQALAKEILSIAQGMRLAGGSILPNPKPETRITSSRWFTWPDNHDNRLKALRILQQSLMPGNVLVSRESLLSRHRDAMCKAAPGSTTLDALLDLCRLNIEPQQSDDTSDKVTWTTRRRYRGWLVPLPVGYAAISPIYPPGEVKNVRDQGVPFRFVESVLSLGEWVRPYRIPQLEQFLWHHDPQPDAGLYRLRNSYSSTDSDNPTI